MDGLSVGVEERKLIWRAIVSERIAQDQKWEKTSTENPLKMLAALVEEVGEVARAILDSDDDNLITELIQVAAVAVCMLEGKSLGISRVRAVGKVHDR